MQHRVAVCGLLPLNALERIMILNTLLIPMCVHAALFDGNQLHTMGLRATSLGHSCTKDCNHERRQALSETNPTGEERSLA